MDLTLRATPRPLQRNRRMKGRRRAAEGKLIERRPAVISALEERQTDSEIKVTGKEQFHRSGPSRRWMCNMSGGGGELGCVEVGGRDYLLCEMSAQRALCRFRAGGLSPVTLRSSVAVDASRARPDETQRGKVKQARRKSGKGKGKTPAGMCGVSAVSPLRESHGKINEESITRAHFEVSVRGSAGLTAPPGRRGSKQAAGACTARSPLAMATATSLPAADLSHQRRTPTTYRHHPPQTSPWTRQAFTR